MSLNQLIKETVLAPFLKCRARAPGRVALTFDDSPHPATTRDLLTVLAARGTRATFFVVGEHAQEHPNLIEAIRRGGHELANHSMTHADITAISRQRMQAEIDDVFALTDTEGRPLMTSRIFRPPFGALTVPLLLYCWRRSIRIVLWNANPRDFEASSADEIIDYFDTSHNLVAGDVVLLHDGPLSTVSALERLLDMLDERALEPVTVSELFGYREDPLYDAEAGV